MAVKTVLAFILSIAAAALTLTPRLGLPLPKALTDPAGFVYAAVHLFLARRVSPLPPLHGQCDRGIFRFRFYNDTLPTLALWASIAYNFCIASGLVEAGPNTSYYTVVPVSVIAFSLLGKLLFVKNVVQNFELAVSSGEKHAGTLIKTSHMPVRFFGGDRKACSIRCATHNGLRNPFPTTLRKASQITTPIASICAAGRPRRSMTEGCFPSSSSALRFLRRCFPSCLFPALYVLSRYSRKTAALYSPAVRHHEDVDMVVAGQDPLSAGQGCGAVHGDQQVGYRRGADCRCESYMRYRRPP